MPEINRRYFDNLLADRQMSLRGLAKLMGMSHSQLSLALSGARRLQIDEAVQIADIFGEPLYRVIESAGVPLRSSGSRRLAVIGAMRGDGTVEEYGDSVVERVNAPDNLPDSAVAIQCRTVGTPMAWLDGAILFCRAPTEVDPGALGRLCYFKIKGGPAAVGALARGYRENTFNSAGPYIGESIAIEFATPIAFTRN